MVTHSNNLTWKISWTEEPDGLQSMFSSVKSLIHVWLFLTPLTTACQAALPSPTPEAYSNSCPLSRWYHPTISSCYPLLVLHSIFHSIRVFSNESVLQIMWPKYWSFSLSISPSNAYSGLISFRMDWLDLLAVQGTLKSLTECGPLGKGMANQFNILALRTPWTVWKCKKIGQWKMNSPGRILVVT